MARAATKTSYVVAREAIVINVGGKPARYARITVTDRRTGLPVEILDTDHPPIEPEETGIAYAYREGQRVRADHEAVQACPSAFVSSEEAEDAGLVDQRT